MKAGELRIGNKVIYNSIVYEVLGIVLSDVKCTPYQYSITLVNPHQPTTIVNLDLIEPISLTEDILISFEFRKNKNIFTKDILFSLTEEDGYFYIVWGDCFKRTTIYDLHSLQNFYFTLTGKIL